MTTLTIAQAEAQVRDFAKRFDTANTRALVAHCEAGRISWFPAYELCRKALAEALAS